MYRINSRTKIVEETLNVKFNELKHAPIPAYLAELFDLDSFQFEPVQADHTTSSPTFHSNPGFDDATNQKSACKSTPHTTTDSENQTSEDISQTSDEQVSTSEVINICSCPETGSSLNRPIPFHETTKTIPFQDEHT